MTSTVTDRSVSPASTPSTGGPRSRGEKIALAVLLTATAGLYLWNLSASGWANAFYSGAVRAMTQNWTAFFFGSTDAANTVTVDKPPASLWIMALSARIFGLSSWSILIPQALMGVGSVALLHAAVRRVSGAVPALTAGFLFALTPVVVLMFRYNNPDALLVLLLLGAAYAVVRAIEGASTRWLLLAGALIGLAFLTKTAQALLPLPALALAYLWAAPTTLWHRIRQLLAAGAAMVVAAGWWFLIAACWPAATAPTSAAPPTAAPGNSPSATTAWAACSANKSAAEAAPSRHHPHNRPRRRHGRGARRRGRAPPRRRWHGIRDPAHVRRHHGSRWGRGRAAGSPRRRGLTTAEGGSLPVAQPSGAVAVPGPDLVPADFLVPVRTRARKLREWEIAARLCWSAHARRNATGTGGL